MMKDIIKINMKIEESEVAYGISIQSGIDEDLTNKERREIEELGRKISKIVDKALRRSIIEEVDEIELINESMKETKKELYESLSEEDKKKVEEFEKKLKNCNTIQDAIKLAIDEIEKELK